MTFNFRQYKSLQDLTDGLRDLPENTGPIGLILYEAHTPEEEVKAEGEIMAKETAESTAETDIYQPEYIDDEE